MEIKSFDDMKLILRENDIPFFTDEDLKRYVEIYGTYEYALYKCLIFKSQNNQMQLAGMSTQDTSGYFRRLARQFRPNNSGVLKS